jgi:hypothetical protein
MGGRGILVMILTESNDRPKGQSSITIAPNYASKVHLGKVVEGPFEASDYGRSFTEPRVGYEFAYF